jgi:hypothetical protein
VSVAKIFEWNSQGKQIGVEFLPEFIFFGKLKQMLPTLTRPVKEAWETGPLLFPKLSGEVFKL